MICTLPPPTSMPKPSLQRGGVHDRQVAVEGLLGAADHAHLEPGALLDRAEELVAVGRVADGAGGHSVHALDAGGVEERGEHGCGVHRPVHRLGLEHALVAHARAHAGGLADLVGEAPPAAGLVLEHHEPERVRPHVDHGQALHRAWMMAAGAAGRARPDACRALTPPLRSVRPVPIAVPHGCLRQDPPQRRPSPAVPTGPQFDNRRVLAGLIDLLVPLGLGCCRGRGRASRSRSGILVVVARLGPLLLLRARVLRRPDARQARDEAARGVGGRQPATDAQIAKRTIVRIVDWNIIGLIVMLASGERRQRLGDMVAGTVVTDALAIGGSSGDRGASAAAACCAGCGARRRGRRPRSGDRVEEEEGGCCRGACGCGCVAPAAVEPKRRRGLKDLAKLEIGGRRRTRRLLSRRAVAAALVRRLRRSQASSA